MKRALIAAALLMSGAAVAQTTDMHADQVPTSTEADADMTDTEIRATVDDDMMADHDMATMNTSADHMAYATTAMMTPASGAVVQPGNANPEEDARGITVLSDAAMVPSGWNGVTGMAMGGPLLDPATGEPIEADESYPACTATITDNCIQAYEVGRD